MGEANTGVRRYDIGATVLNKIASGKEQGSGYPGLPMPGQPVDNKEAWEQWVEEEAIREGVHKVMKRLSQSILDESLSIWKGEQEHDRSEAEERRFSHRRHR